MLIGVTGTVGSGKSLVAGRLAALLEARCFSADRAARELLEVGRPGYQALVNAWGDRYLQADRTVDRRLLRRTVFTDAPIREQLESLLHPLIAQELQDLRRKTPIGTGIVAEIPLLYECGWQDQFDGVIFVLATPADSIARVVERDQVPAADVERMLEAQLDGAHKRRLADWVIDNTKTIAETETQIEELSRLLKKRFNRSSIQ